jgi:hypothetical protein
LNKEMAGREESACRLPEAVVGEDHTLTLWSSRKPAVVSHWLWSGAPRQSATPGAVAVQAPEQCELQPEQCAAQPPPFGRTWPTSL